MQVHRCVEQSRTNSLVGRPIRPPHHARELTVYREGTYRRQKAKQAKEHWKQVTGYLGRYRVRDSEQLNWGTGEFVLPSPFPPL